MAIEFDTLLHQHHQSAEVRRNLLRLHGARFACANETPVNARWNEAMMKQLTGSDTIVVRRLFEELFQFTPEFALWCRANERPTTYDHSHAFWRRMKLIPFTRVFDGKAKDDTLKATLLAELPGILNWAIAGCRRWQGRGEPTRPGKRRRLPTGLREPAAVTEETHRYQQDQNVLGEFIGSRCVLETSAWTPTADLYRAFTKWWRSTRGPDTSPPIRDTFARWLRSQPGLQAKARKRPGSRKKERGWDGLRLRSAAR